MKERKEILDYGMTLPDVYMDAPFHDDNWILLRYKKNKRAFAWTYERNGNICVNVKVDPEWRDFWRSAYASVLPGYHQNKEHWNTIILDGKLIHDFLIHLFKSESGEDSGMIREAKEGELNEILQLYLYLHETNIPDDTEHLRTVWSEIINDKHHHLIVCEVD